MEDLCFTHVTSVMETFANCILLNRQSSLICILVADHQAAGPGCVGGLETTTRQARVRGTLDRPRGRRNGLIVQSRKVTRKKTGASELLTKYIAVPVYPLTLVAAVLVDVFDD